MQHPPPDTQTQTLPLPLIDGPVDFAGAISLQPTDDGVQPWRLVYDDLALYEPALRERGDANLHYIDGLALFGHAFVHHMPDQLHPDGEGNHVLADRYSSVVMPSFELTEAKPASAQK